MILPYLKYRLKRRSKYRIHSPFVYDLIEDVFKDKRAYYAFEEIEKIRRNLLEDKQLVNVGSFGAGSKRNDRSIRSVKDICRHTASPPKQGELLFRLANKFKPQRMLELGTSLGISAMYQAKACPKSQLITLEGSAELAKLARANLKNTGLFNVEVLQGEFKDKLLPALQKLEGIDWFYIDGHHEQHATLDYFNSCFPYMSRKCLFIFDDIHWSAGMTKAWNEIILNAGASISIDLFFKGLLFFNDDIKEDQHFVL